MLTEIERAAALTAMKVPRGLHDSDPPRKLLQEAAAIFARPLTIIFNTCLQNGVWPRLWKEERTTMLVKNKPARKRGDFRPIAITYFFGKTLESIVKRYIMQDVDGKIDARQFGGLSSSSSDNYFSSLFQSIMDTANDGKASLLICYDFAKAFNSSIHSAVIEAAASLGIRLAILRLLAG